MLKKMTIRAGLFTTGALLLSGCMASSVSMAQLLVDSVDGLEAIQNERTTMPTSGTATYTGSVTGFVADSPTDQNVRLLAGEASMTATFTGTGGSVSGTLSNFIGKNNVDVNALSDAVNSGNVNRVDAIIADYDDIGGTIRIQNGRISGQQFADANVSGTLNHNGDTLRFGGSMGGAFSGSDAQGLKAYSDTTNGWSGGDPLTITENGNPKAGMLYVNALE